MKDCPYCYREKEVSIQPHYTKHMTEKGETWVAYCPSCGRRTPYYSGGKVNTIEQAKVAWNRFDLPYIVEPDDVPCQTFSPD